MKTLFKQVEQIVLKMQLAEKESRLRGEQFNMFSACGVNHYENTHSLIIAELLNPQGSHGQGTIFLEAFLAFSKIDLDFYLDKGAEVCTEYVTPVGRIDIMITNPHGQAVIVENKIYAQDQPEQLKRYNEYAHEKYGEGKYAMLYLTLMGSEASEQSCKGVNYVKLSYACDIVEWLKNCIHIAARIPLIRETLVQYKNHILKLTNQTMERIGQEELYEAMICHINETEAIVNAVNHGYFEYVWAKYVKPVFETFAKEHGLIYVDKHIYFHRPEWKKTAIRIFVDGGCHYIGVTSTQNGSLEDLNQLPQHKLECLSDNPNEWWPYGWQLLTPYERWNAGDGTIPAMIDGRFANFVQKKILEIISEIESKNLKMI